MPKEYIELLLLLGLDGSRANEPQSVFEDDSPPQSQSWCLGLELDEISHILDRLGVSSGPLTPQAEFILAKMDTMPALQAVKILRDTLAEHMGDINFPSADMALIESLLAVPDIEAYMVPTEPSDKDLAEDQKQNYLERDPRVFWLAQARLEAALIWYHSPYPEVRAVVDPYDDPTVPVETFRVYVIALFWTAVGSVINNFFVHRLPGISLSTSTVQLLLLPSGRLWEKVMPHKILRLGPWSFQLNPGPWTSKEMMLASIMYLCSAGTPYAVYNIVVMKLDRFYGLKWVSAVYQLLFALLTQFLGFAFAFLMLKVCVYPKRAVWPTILPVIALNRALMDHDPPTNIHGWRISRYGFFFVAFAASFAYSWVPSYFFTALSTFNWPTWFAPNLVHLNNVTGFNSGLGLNPWPTFDWNMFDIAGCLTIPFFTYVNHFCGMCLAFFVILGVYYTNTRWTGYFPINSNRLFNNKGQVYDVHLILNSESAFDNSKYQAYGPPYFSAANLVLYGAYFFLYPFAILYHTVTEWLLMSQSFVNIWHTIKDTFSKEQSHSAKFAHDPHCQMMKAYPEVPSTWFLAILVASVTLAVLCVWFFPVETPVWGIFFTILLNFVFLVPITAIASVTGFTFGLNVLVELIVGYAIPNSGLALITLKAYGYNIDSQASNYITDQKLAHYAKIPPRAIFRGQILSTFLSVLLALLIANWQIAHIPDLCQPNQKNRLLCPGANTFFFSSIQYGEIGPAKVFGGLYPVLKWCFLWGALAVLPLAWFKKHGPKRVTHYFQPTVIIGGFLAYAPYNMLYYLGGLYLSFVFMHHIKRRYTLWWEKYNYILTSALSSGVAFSALLIFFVQYSGVDVDWWGNRLSSMGIEGMSDKPTWLQAEDAPDGYVGLRQGNYP